jgi:hypothetical protein
MTTASTHSTDMPDAEVINNLIAALGKDATALGKDDASRCVRADVQALQAAIEGGGSTVASRLSALDTSVDRLHLSHMRPLLKQMLRSLRTALNMDVDYTRKTSGYEQRRMD